jgi:RNA polymerase sigma-70 factor (ECF subfamily)
MKLLQNICAQRELKQRVASMHGRMYRVAYAWGHDKELASDIVQEAIAKALKSLSQLRETEKLDSWMFGIMTNCWRDHFRNKRDIANIDDVEIELTDMNTPERIQHKQDIVINVRNAVAQLPAAQRYVVTLVDLEGFSYTQVAEIMDIPIGTVMSRLSRARKQLAAMLLEFKPETAQEQPADRPHLRRIK